MRVKRTTYPPPPTQAPKRIFGSVCNIFEDLEKRNEINEDKKWSVIFCEYLYVYYV